MKGKFSRFIYFTTSIMMTIFIFTACANTDIKTPKDIATSYFENAKSGNIKEFEKMFTDDAKKAVDKYGGMQDLINYVVQDGKLKKYEIKDVKEEKDTARVTVVLTYKDNSTKNTYINLIKEKNQWKIKY